MISVAYLKNETNETLFNIKFLPEIFGNIQQVGNKGGKMGLDSPNLFILHSELGVYTRASYPMFFSSNAFPRFSQQFNAEHYCNRIPKPKKLISLMFCCYGNCHKKRTQILRLPIQPITFKIHALFVNVSCIYSSF